MQTGKPMSAETATRDRIHELVTGNRVMLFMKGTPKMPQCGFSAQTAGVLDGLLGNDYATFNVLEDEAVREGIKEYGNWPTIPQLYVGGELVGGCDIIIEMFNAGELHPLLGLEPPDRTPPDIEITEAAATRIREFMDAYPDQQLHLTIDAGFGAQFQLGPRQGSEIASESAGITVLTDLASAQRARGAKIDWVSTVEGEGLKLDLPGAPPPVKEITPAELQDRINAGERIQVVDTRGEDDRQQKPLEFARPLNADLMAELKDADRNLPLVFICNRGHSSREVAEHYRRQGFTQIFSLTGGADALAG